MAGLPGRPARLAVSIGTGFGSAEEVILAYIAMRNGG